MTTLGIIEDQPAIRDALTCYLDKQLDIACVLAAPSVEEFITGLARLPELPAVVLSDISLPGLSGIEGLALLQRCLPEAAVVMFSIHTNAERVFEALRAGAVGYLDKITPLPMLAELLRQVAAGGSPMSPSVARHVIQHFWPRPTPVPADLTALTPREQEVVRGIEDGLSYKLIGERLGMSLDTVRSHIRQVYRKLHVNSKAEILAKIRPPLFR